MAGLYTLGIATSRTVDVLAGDLLARSSRHKGTEADPFLCARRHHLNGPAGPNPTIALIGGASIQIASVTALPGEPVADEKGTTLVTGAIVSVRRGFHKQYLSADENNARSGALLAIDR